VRIAASRPPTDRRVRLLSHAERSPRRIGARADRIDARSSPRPPFRARARVDGRRLLDLMQHRFSPYAWSAREVEDAKLRRVLEAAASGPSAMNEQPWRFIVARRGSAAFERMVELLRASNRAWAPQAPVLILALTKSSFSKNGSRNEYAEHDLGYATALLNLEAEALGLRTHVMAGPRKADSSPIGFEVDKAREAFSVPDGFVPFTIIALGYEGAPANLPTELRELEEKRRAEHRSGAHRKPFDQIAALSAEGVAALFA
jgi:nitroreductase